MLPGVSGSHGTKDLTVVSDYRPPMTEQTGREHPATFVRRYATTWVHALATAALTALGTLTVVDNRFAAVALAAYAVPPFVLYLRGGVDAGTAGDTPTTETTPAAETTSATGPASSPEARWTTTSVPADEHLHDVVTGGGEVYAAGDDGTVLATDGDDWSVLLSDGPRARSNALRGIDAAGASGVWVVGDGGTVARLDPDTGRHVDHAEPGGDTTNLVDVAVAEGADGAVETVLVADGSGRVRRGEYRDADGEVVWAEPVTPGSGSSVAGIALRTDAEGWVCDTSQRVFETGDGGQTFTQTGIDGVSGTLTDVGVTESAVSLCDDDGVVYRENGGSWTPVRVADSGLLAVAGRGERWLACGDGGALSEREPDSGWERATTPANSPLRGVAVSGSQAIAVGDDGTVVERRSR